MYAIIWLIDTLLTLALWIIIAQVVMSWLIQFEVVNLRQPFVYQVWQALNRLTEPVYRRIRRFLPDLGGIDLSPIIAGLAIIFVQRLIIFDLARAVL